MDKYVQLVENTLNEKNEKKPSKGILATDKDINELIIYAKKLKLKPQKSSKVKFFVGSYDNLEDSSHAVLIMNDNVPWETFYGEGIRDMKIDFNIEYLKDKLRDFEKGIKKKKKEHAKLQLPRKDFYLNFIGDKKILNFGKTRNADETIDDLFTNTSRVVTGDALEPSSLYLAVHLAKDLGLDEFSTKPRYTSKELDKLVSDAKKVLSKEMKLFKNKVKQTLGIEISFGKTDKLDDLLGVRIRKGENMLLKRYGDELDQAYTTFSVSKSGELNINGQDHGKTYDSDKGWIKKDNEDDAPSFEDDVDFL
jgi:hypothetical protein